LLKTVKNTAKNTPFQIGVKSADLLSRSLSPTMIAEYRRLLPKEVLRKSLDEFAAFFDTGKEDGDNAD
jgi:hypothetical protein